MVIALVSFGISGFLGFFMWEERFVFEPKWYVILMVLTIVAHYATRILMNERNKRIHRLVILTVSIYFVLTISSFIYHYWIFDNFLTPSFMMKVSLIIFSLTALYFNYVLSNLNTTYKKKRENQRIKKETESVKVSELKSKFKKKKNGPEQPKEVRITLGVSAQNEEE